MLNRYATQIHTDNVRAGWWSPPRPVAVTLMLIVTEISEASEAAGPPMKKDDKLVNRWGLEVELADAAIRIFDLAGREKVDLDQCQAALLGENKRYRSPLPVQRALMEIVNEISRATEGDRKADRARFQTGLTAALQRIIELAGDLRLDLWTAIAEKCAFNATRADHQLENRAKTGGKSY